MTIRHYENFPVASILCPPRLRPAVQAIYRFARTADDLADEGEAAVSTRLAAIARYRDELQRACRGESARDWPEVFQPLAAQIAEHALPVDRLEALLDAFAQDCANPRYSDRSQLLDYCRRSANPIGRLLLHLYRIDDDFSLEQSDAICTSLQLANFWQDASVDLPRGRNYFPLEDLRRHRLTPDDLRAGDSPATQAMLSDLVDWAQQLMRSGSPLATRIPGRAGWELRLVVQGGLRILGRIRGMHFRTLASRPALGRADLLPMAWHCLWMSGSSRAQAGAAA